MRLGFIQYYGEVPEWPKGTDCKSVGVAFGGSNPPLPIFYGLWVLLCVSVSLRITRRILAKKVF